MSSLLSGHVDNLSGGLQNYKCTDCKSCLNYISTKDNQLTFKCIKCRKIYKKHFNKYLIERFANIYRFWERDINKFILLLRKGVYPCKYTDNWERLGEILLPDKEDFYSNLNMKGIRDANYTHEKKVEKDFKKNSWWVSWRVPSEWYIITCRCIWKL